MNVTSQHTHLTIHMKIWQDDITIWLDDITIWQGDITIWLDDKLLWKVVAEIFHHRFQTQLAQMMKNLHVN